MAYATQTQFEQHGLPARALGDPVTPAIIAEHLENAAALIDSYLRGRYALPLAEPYPREVVNANIALAAYTLLVWRGFNPDEYDANFKDRHDLTMSWLSRLAKGEVQLAVTADATPTVFEGAAIVESGSHRGWDALDEGVGEPRGYFWAPGKWD